MHCTSCGSKSPTGAVFCQNCGAKIDSNPVNNVMRTGGQISRSHLATPTPPADMDYTFYPGQMTESGLDEPKHRNKNYSNLLDYPIEPAFLKPAENSAHPVGLGLFSSDGSEAQPPHPIPLYAPHPEPEYIPPSMQVHTPQALPQPQPLYADQHVSPQPQPLYADEQASPQPQPLYADQQASPQPQPQIIYADPQVEFEPHHEMWQVYDESGDMVTHMPPRRSLLRVILIALAILVIAATATVIYVSRRGNVNPNNVVGTWAQSPTLVSWVPKFEFNEDGTGQFFELNSSHNTVRHDVAFTWSIEDGNMMKSSLWTEMAEIELRMDTYPPRLRYRFYGERWRTFVLVE